MSEDTTVHAVYYTDGGCRPSRGIGGWGVQGYLYNENKPTSGTGLKTHYITKHGYVPMADVKEDNVFELTGIESLAVLKKDPKLANVSVEKYLDGLGSLIPESTNNEAELTATIQSLKHAIENGAKSVLVWTDSKYVQRGLNEWVEKWERHNWIKPDGVPVANKDKWIELLDLMKKLRDADVALDISKVKGHSGDLGNDLADGYATMGIIAGRKGKEVFSMEENDPKGYWAPKVSVNRMISQSRWYFNTNVPAGVCEDGRTVYHLGDNGGDDHMTGKRISDATCSVVFLKEPEPIMEAMREFQNEISVPGFSSLVIGRLDMIFRPKVYQEVSKHHTTFLQQANVKRDIYTADETRLTEEMNPPLLHFNKVDAMSFMEQMLMWVSEGPEQHKLVKTDITDLLYEVEEGKKKTTCKLKASLTSAVKSLSVPVDFDTGKHEGNCNITLTVGIDTPTRNTLAALADRFPKVSVITWTESHNAFRFATVVEVEEDIGMWAGFYSNLHLITG